jgi:hypothetical protein
MFRWHSSARHLCRFCKFENIVSQLNLHAIFKSVGKYHSENRREIRILFLFTGMMKE